MLHATMQNLQRQRIGVPADVSSVLIVRTVCPLGGSRHLALDLEQNLAKQERAGFSLATDMSSSCPKCYESSTSFRKACEGANTGWLVSELDQMECLTANGVMAWHSIDSPIRSRVLARSEQRALSQPIVSLFAPPAATKQRETRIPDVLIGGYIVT